MEENGQVELVDRKTSSGSKIKEATLCEPLVSQVDATVTDKSRRQLSFAANLVESCYNVTNFKTL